MKRWLSITLLPIALVLGAVGVLAGRHSSDAEAEAAETQVWTDFAVQCGYLKIEVGKELSNAYDNILGKLVSLINDPRPWLLPGAKLR